MTQFDSENGARGGITKTTKTGHRGMEMTMEQGGCHLFLTGKHS